MGNYSYKIKLEVIYTEIGNYLSHSISPYTRSVHELWAVIKYLCTIPVRHGLSVPSSKGVNQHVKTSPVNKTQS